MLILFLQFHKIFASRNAYENPTTWEVSEIENDMESMTVVTQVNLEGIPVTQGQIIASLESSSGTHIRGFKSELTGPIPFGHYVGQYHFQFLVWGRASENNTAITFYYANDDVDEVHILSPQSSFIYDQTYSLGTARNLFILTESSSLNIPPSDVSDIVSPPTPSDPFPPANDVTEVLYTQTISVPVGWSWVSFNVAPLNPAAHEVFSDIFLENAVLKNQSSVLQYDNTGFLETNITTDTKYILKVDTEGTISVRGVPELLPKDLQIYEAWNWIPCPYQVPTSITNLTFDFSNGDVLKSQKTFSEYSERHGWIGQLKVLEPGLGYQLFTHKSGMLRFA